MRFFTKTRINNDATAVVFEFDRIFLVSGLVDVERLLPEKDHEDRRTARLSQMIRRFL